MNNGFAFLLMFFAHVVDDYYLQGWLAQGKQRSWWEKNAPEPLYKLDYIVALLMHSFSWSFMIMLPITFCANLQIGTGFVIALVCNMLVHAFVDNLKANCAKINLVIDQTIHIAQIIITAWVFIL